jgi:hypothetical protein
MYHREKHIKACLHDATSRMKIVAWNIILQCKRSRIWFFITGNRQVICYKKLHATRFMLLVASCKQAFREIAYLLSVNSYQSNVGLPISKQNELRQTQSDTHKVGLSIITTKSWYLQFHALLKNFSLIWRRHHCRWRATKFRPMLGAQGLWEGRDLYCATPAVTRGLGFPVSSEGPPHLVASYDTHWDAWIYSNPNPHAGWYLYV